MTAGACRKSSSQHDGTIQHLPSARLPTADADDVLRGLAVLALGRLAAVFFVVPLDFLGFAAAGLSAFSAFSVFSVFSFFSDFLAGVFLVVVVVVVAAGVLVVPFGPVSTVLFALTMR